jgi:flagellar protein FlaJ
MTEQVALQVPKARTMLERKLRSRESLAFGSKSRLGRVIERLTAKNAVENELYFVITYLYGLATSYCSLLDMFSYVAQSEFERCGRLFNRVKVLARTWHLGFVNALEEVARNAKSALLKDFLERFSQMIKTGEMYDKFLMMEHEAYVVAYEAEYERSLKSVENLGNAYSAIITSVTFVAITLTLTQALMGTSGGANFQAVSTELALVLVATLVLSVFILYLVSPVDGFIYMNKDLRKPKEFSRLKKLFPVSILSSIVLSVAAAFLAPSQPTSGWVLLTMSVPLLPIGIIAKRADNAVRAKENAFPTFIRTLGTTAGITGYSTARALKLLLVRDFGILSTQVKALHSRLAIGVDSKLCWRNLASECGSEMIRIFGGVYEATVSLGGDPGEIGKMISRNMLRRLVLRAKRIQVASSIRAMIYPMHAIECALLAFMTTLLEFLVKMVNIGSQYGSSIGLFQSSINPGSIAPLFNSIMILMAITNAIALKTTEVSNNYRFLYHLSILVMMTGGVMVGVSFVAGLLFKNMFNFQLMPGVSS